jgi:hypothetical protein
MDEHIHEISWEAYEHHHTRESDWFWILGIFAVATSIAAMLLGNVLLGILILLGSVVASIAAMRDPKIVSYAVSQRGVRIDETLYPYTTLECFCIDEKGPMGPQLFVKSEKLFMPLLILPLPADAERDIENLISSRLPEKHLEEPFAHILLEYFKF